MDSNLVVGRVTGWCGSWRNNFIRMSKYNPRWSDDETYVKGVIAQAIMKLFICLMEKQ